MSFKNSIQVGIKVRPLLKKEQQTLWRVVNNSIQQADTQAEPFYFDHIFDQDATNQDIFDKMAKHIVHSTIQGFNGTIFAYGQTSSGKTYTMMGDDDNPGVMVLAAKEIFREIELATARQFLLRVGYIEIYNEKIADLLNKKNQELKIHETPNGIITVNCEECIITCEDDLLQLLKQGSKERTVGETNMNERSSRSHAIFRITIESRKMDRSEDDAIIQSVLNLVDLAGSERADQTGARGTRLKEGGHINKSLLFLSNVIKRLSENEDHKYISYRDSKLTRILQDSLGGNALTAIICTIKPTAIEETQSTLNFALRAKSIKNKPQVNETVSDATMMKRMERELKMLRLRLAEEQKKNGSQIKVLQLEEHIGNEGLKFITSDSLHSVRNREKRRRTWCPSSTNIPSLSGVPSNSAAPPSRLQPPKSYHYHTPLVTMRPHVESPPAPKLLAEGAIPDANEEFVPSETVNFERLSPPKSNLTPRCSMTPKVTTNPKLTLEKVEHDLLELQAFTNLENQIDVRHETDSSLKQLVDSLTNRISLLENERIEYIQLKDEHAITCENLSDYESRCDALQIQVSKLTSSNKSANEKLAKYERELAELKKSNEKLEMENREVVNIEFEFKRHKTKAKLRETELIEALNDKEREVSKLEKSLKSISNANLVNSKENLLQLSLTESKIDENGQVCIKCVDLQRILIENEKVTQEFAKLTLEYEELRSNFQQIEKENEHSKLKVSELEELQKNERAECDQLQKELEALRAKLQSIQSDYEQVNLENASKTEECTSLNQQVEVAKQEMVVLQEKYNKLEVSWQEQQQTLKDIECQYAEIESKYKHLQSEYEQLESSKGQSMTDCERLQKENVELQTEIVELKQKVQDVHKQLLEGESAAAAKAQEEKSQETTDLKQQLSEIQTQFNDLQREYDDLSNQLMDNLQESDTLKEQNTKLEEQVKALEMKNLEVTRTEAEISELKSQMEQVLASAERKHSLATPSFHRNSSMRSSGVGIDELCGFEDSPRDDHGDADLLRKFNQLSESIAQIELEHQNGRRRVFKTPTLPQTPNYKLCLRNISSVSRIQKDFVDEMENIHLQGSFKQHSFHIVELSTLENGGERQSSHTNGTNDTNGDVQCAEIDTNVCNDCIDVVTKLKEQITQLRLLNEQEHQSNKSLLENTERTLSEMRDQITQLSAELLEKSIFVENCACKTYQIQIENLEKEKADITLVFEELQEKVNNYTFDGSLRMDCTLSEQSETHTNDLKKDLELLQTKEREMLETLDSQTKMLEDLTQRNLDLEMDLKSAQDQLATQEKEYKEQCHQLQLEILQKLEISASEHRDNMKKYNKEWEERKDTYEAAIKEFEEQIAALKSENEQADLKAQQIEEELQKVKAEFQQLQDQHKELHNQTEVNGEQASASATQQLEVLQEDYRQQQRELHETMQNLKNSEETFAKANEELKGLREELEVLQSQHLRLQEQHKEQENAKTEEMEQLKEDCAQLQTKLQESLKKLEEYMIASDTKGKELEELRETLLRDNTLAEEKAHELQEQLQAKEVCANELSQELEKLKETVKSLNQDIEEQNKAQQELLKDLDTFKHKEEQLSQEKAALDTSLLSLRDEFKQLNDQYNQLVQEKDTICQEKIEFCRKLSILEEKQGSDSELQERMQKMAEEIKQLLQERQQILNKLQIAEAQIQEYCSEDSAREEMIKTFHSKVTSLEAMQSEKDTLCAKLEAEQSEMSKRLELLLEEKQMLEKNLFDLREEDELQQKNSQEQLKSLEEEMTNLKGKLENAEAEKMVLKDKVKELEGLQPKTATLEAELMELKSVSEEKNTLEEHLQAMKNAKSDLETQLQQLKIDSEENLKIIENLRQEEQSLEALQQEKETLQELLDSNTQKMEILEHQSKSLEEQLQRERETAEEKLNELDIAIEKRNAVQSEHDSLLEEKQQLVGNIKNLIDQVNGQLEELQKTKADLDDCKQRETKLVKENATLKASLSTLTNSNSNLKLEKCQTEEKLQQCNTELQELRNEYKELELQLRALAEDKKSLAQQCNQYAEEISSFKDQLTCLKEKENAQEILEQVMLEKSELSQNLVLTNEKLSNKIKEIEVLHKENQDSKYNLELLKHSLQTANYEKEKLESKLQNYQHLSEEKSKLEDTISHLKRSHGTALAELQRTKDQLTQNLIKYEHEFSVFKQNEDTLKHKVEKLEQEMHEMKAKVKSYENLMQEQEEVERSLQAASNQNQKLSDEIQTLKASNQMQNVKIQELEAQLMQTKQAEQDLRVKLCDLQENVGDEQKSLQRQMQDLTTSLAELQLKCDTLQASNTQLEDLNQKLQKQLQEAQIKLQEGTAVQMQLAALNTEYAELKKKLEDTIEEAGRCSQTLIDDLQYHKKLLENQLQSYNELRAEMDNKQKSYEEEKEALTSTVTALENSKTMLEEKLREITINNLKMDVEKQTTDTSANTSLEGNNGSPRPRRSLESMNTSIEDKISVCLPQKKIQQSNERKNRRLSSFDERRRQSHWSISNDKETMTDPIVPDCNCDELDRKLKECERTLYIRDSQVTALRMELKNHPLKEEKAALVKRLQEEQEKNRNEIKRFKQKIYEQTQKAEKAIAAAAQAETKQQITEATTLPVAPAIQIEKNSVETQTDCDLSASLTTLQGKYNDLINICRYRKTVIKNLEDRIAEKENADGNSMNPMDAAQVVFLQSQCESMKKELNVIKEKYEYAKTVLHKRREEIQKLRSQLNQS
ncbi:centromere-associated protein E [Stomoxys calcitrans]|uniref:centromere-associated protein E n=1 Tax=Stomoxys calcitrans TaxID=35570 RepID=UPI0027E2CB9C|nr:centromere-associated protein E [Stomoxys calcitrans]